MIKPFIREANMNDFYKILEFIKNYWDGNHIFVKHPELMKYQHIINNQLTYIIAEDIYTKNICAICGWISSNLTATPDINLVMWRALKTTHPMIGLESVMYMKSNLNPRLFCSCGINKDTTQNIFSFLGYFTSKLNHYYRLADINKYTIAIVNKKNIIPIKEIPKYKLIKIDSFKNLKKIFSFKKYKNSKPYKDEWYINHRYFNHPVYNYKIYGIEKTNNSCTLDSILVAREVTYNNSKVLRIVDFIGLDKDLEGISYELQNLIDCCNYEYIDFYCYGIKHEIMTKAGFILRDDSDKNIIPNYFEPFVQNNIDINFFSNDKENFHMYKADGDQDRPNYY